MKKITVENFDAEYEDSIEQQQIDKFVCDEMGRQIHRYIKGMSGSKQIMLKFEEQLSSLTIAQKEDAIARYIDLNRKAISGLDFKIVLTRAIGQLLRHVQLPAYARERQAKNGVLPEPHQE